MDYFKFTNHLEPSKGRLLLSEPFLPDPNFERTVVLLCEHNDDGSFGFVLNKVSAVSLEDIVEGITNFDRDVYIGGPVQQDSLHFLHRSTELEGGTEIVDGLYWGGNFEQLMSMIEMRQVKPGDFKFFVGYSGWETGQLEKELKADSWIVTSEATPDLVFDQEEDVMWKSVLNRLGGRFSVYSNYPIDPRLN
ncbi:YqgE/AlgH family protein [Fulvivirga sp. M361]|uniref:YqgE/AlgH family protein n=1 Tax=Fulvivirga sp. M361 TaxID=2594266 RepID=UPI00117AA2DA|nr:YqgE/AlgH family protein [Fulvivirga sp. M361]TRX60701.1 YqgE/AlgH family protein [Fulvivirga sp. M361]